LPLGLPGADEAALEAAVAGALPWADRDRRLLVPPMKCTCRLRAGYLAHLSRPEFAHLVHLERERLPLLDFLRLLARHRAVLSPPGKGYDCLRTWQVLAVGCELLPQPQPQPQP
jgi:hypothetical protein